MEDVKSCEKKTKALISLNNFIKKILNLRFTILRNIKHMWRPYDTGKKSADYGVAPRYKYALGGVTYGWELALYILEAVFYWLYKILVVLLIVGVPPKAGM